MYLLGRAEKYGATVNVLAFTLSHRPRSGFGREYAFVAVLFQLRQEEIVKLFRFNLLKNIKTQAFKRVVFNRAARKRHFNLSKIIEKCNSYKISIMHHVIKVQL